ncbi:MAG: DNA (cytosine-5-)-methyltransferase, partial [Chryseobacterium sp.]
MVKLLKEEGLYTDQKHFKDSILKTIHLVQAVGKNINEITFIDLFAGIGGMRQGFEKAGGRCVFSSEFEKNAQRTYEENYGEFPFGDITQVDPRDIPSHDIL